MRDLFGHCREMLARLNGTDESALKKKRKSEILKLMATRQKAFLRPVTAEPVKRPANGKQEWARGRKKY